MQIKSFHLIQNVLHLYKGPRNSLCPGLLSVAAIKTHTKDNLGQKEFLCLILPRPLRGLFFLTLQVFYKCIVARILCSLRFMGIQKPLCILCIYIFLMLFSSVFFLSLALFWFVFILFYFTFII